MASQVDDDNDDAWSGSDCEAADEEPKVAALTDPSKLFATAQEALDFDKTQGFDLRACKVNDFYGAVKLVNFVRKAVADGVNASELQTVCASVIELDDDHLKPVLENDELLSRLEEVFELKDDSDSAATGS